MFEQGLSDPHTIVKGLEMKLVNILAMTSVLLLGPGLVNSVNLVGFQDAEAAWAGGNGKGGGGGKSRGKSEARGGGKPVSAGQGNRTASVKAAKAAKAPKALHANLSSQLKGLNSLNRNINGLMNSSDPKMEPFRGFVSNSAELEGLKVALADAGANYDGSLADFLAAAGELGLSEDPATAQAELDVQLADLLASEPAIDDAAYGDWEAAVAAATDAQATLDQLAVDQAALDDAETAVADGEAATSEEAMIEAMVASLNATGAGPVTTEDITPEMVEWVAAKLGVGAEQHGLIDDWLAQL
jgi:hypothetical protein